MARGCAPSRETYTKGVSNSPEGANKTKIHTEVLRLRTLN